MSYLLKPSGDGAFRLRLKRVDGEDWADALIAGVQDEVTVDLPPGEYIVYAFPLGRSPQVSVEFQLALGEARVVRLPDMSGWEFSLRRDGGGAQTSTEIRSTRLTRRLSPVADAESDKDSASSQAARFQEQVRLRRQWNSKHPLNLAGMFSFLTTSSFAALNSIPFVMESDRRISIPTGYRHFCIALSEDESPEKRGGWARPVHTQVKQIMALDGYSFEIHPPPKCTAKFRTRMTISLQGFAAIRVPIPMYVDGTVIRVRPTIIGGRPDFSIEIIAKNPKVQELIVAMTELSSEDAVRVLESNVSSSIENAVDILARKYEDLWAASAAALLLVRARRLEQIEGWHINLARLAPHIPDASIAAAWAVAATDHSEMIETEDIIMKYLSQALSVGAPTLSLGNSLALDLLSILMNSAKQNAARNKARKIFIKIASRTRYKIYRGPYMIWEQSGVRLQSGRLVGPRYMVLVSGQL